MGNDTLRFSYDAMGSPMTVTWNGEVYTYVTNLQGDVIHILDSTGNPVVSYDYDAWGCVVNTSGAMALILGAINPLRYRGYVYDAESGLYYLQSRYYNPELGRFISPDAFVATGQGQLGNNMFAYCNNNPVNFFDSDGKEPTAVQWWTGGMWWLCAIDLAAPVGDLIYIVGIIALGAIAIVASQENISEIVFDDADTSPEPLPPTNNDEDDEYDDEYYDDERNFAGRKKIGKKIGNAPTSNSAQNEQTRSIAKKHNLSYKQQDELHRLISRQGYKYSEVLDELHLLGRK